VRRRESSGCRIEYRCPTIANGVDGVLSSVALAQTAKPRFSPAGRSGAQVGGPLIPGSDTGLNGVSTMLFAVAWSRETDGTTTCFGKFRGRKQALLEQRADEKPAALRQELDISGAIQNRVDANAPA
jgi:hypothetical protein